MPPTKTQPETDVEQTEASANGTRPDGKKTGERRTYGPGDTVPVQVTVPFELHTLLLDNAKAADEAIKYAGDSSIAELARHMLAARVDFTLPERQRKAPATAKSAEEWLKSKQRSSAAQEHANKIYDLVETLKARTGAGNLDELIARISAQQAEVAAEAANR